MLPKRLQTERLVLRPFVKADSRAVFDYWNSDPSSQTRRSTVCCERSGRAERAADFSSAELIFSPRSITISDR